MANDWVNAANRYRIHFPAKHSLRAKLDSGVDTVSSKLMTPSLLAAEKEEAKAVLTLFLKNQGLSSAFASRSINKSDLFVDHLVSKLHSAHKSRYMIGKSSLQSYYHSFSDKLPTGRELSTLEIREALVPYLDTLLEEHGDLLMNVIENFPNQHNGVKRVTPAPSTSPNLTPDAKKLRALLRVTSAQLPPHILYLMDMGMDLERIKRIIRRFPAFAYYSLDGKIKPLVEFLIALGVEKSDIPTILNKRPQLCGISLSDNLVPTMEFLESLGVDKKKWAKVIYRFPALLTYRRQKIEESVSFMYDLGVSEESIGKILTRCPNIISYNVEDNLRPTADYFTSLGVDVALLLQRCPQNLGLSIESNLKPITEFFLEQGYSMEDVAAMISRNGALYTFSLESSLKPKWDFFLTMDYPKEELIKFPQYFGYSLEERIKPRYAAVRNSGVRVILNQILSLSDAGFETLLKKRIEKLNGGKGLRL